MILWDLFTKNLDKNIKYNKLTNYKKRIFIEEKKISQLSFGQTTGLVSKKKLRKIKKGNLLIEKKLDLHGFTQKEAKKELEIFLNDCISQNKRLVLVITGKGHVEKGGVIKNNISKWLNEKNTRTKILGFDYASPRHGGTGAIYIFLKKF